MHDTIEVNKIKIPSQYIIHISRSGFNDNRVMLDDIFDNINTLEVKLANNHQKIDSYIIDYNKFVNYENTFIGKWVANRHKNDLIKSESRRRLSFLGIKRHKDNNVELENLIEHNKLLKEQILELMQIQVDKNDWNLGRGKLHINNEDQSVELEVDGIRTQIKPETKKSLFENIANDLNIKILNYNTKYSDLIKEKNKSTRLTTKVLTTYKGRTTTEISKDIEEILEVIKKTNDKIRLNRSNLDDFNIK